LKNLTEFIDKFIDFISAAASVKVGENIIAAPGGGGGPAPRASIVGIPNTIAGFAAQLQ
jgi:hypothetical protein